MHNITTGCAQITQLSAYTYIQIRAHTHTHTHVYT